MTAIDYEVVSGQLEINGVELRGPAWFVINLLPLWSSPEVRGQDRLLPRAFGVRPFPRRPTVTTRVLRMVITGEVDQFGEPASEDCDLEDYMVQLEENINFLQEFVAEVYDTPDGTVTATLTMPSGEMRTGPIHVLGLEIQDNVIALPHLAAADLELSIPKGKLWRPAP